MKHQSFHRILSLLLIMPILLGMIPAVFAAGEAEATNYVTNGGFDTISGTWDTSPVGWAITESNSASAAAPDVGRSGNGVQFGGSSTESFDGTVTQTVTDLSAGTYTLSFYFKEAYSTTCTTREVSVSGTAEKQQDINGDTNWTENTVSDIVLDQDGSLTISFHVASANWAYGFLDDVSLTKNDDVGEEPADPKPTPTPDGRFTAAIGTSPITDTWTVAQSGAKLTAEMTSDGLVLTLPASETEYNTQITQYVSGLEAGATYKFSAKTKLLGGTAPSTAYIYAVDTSGSWNSTGGNFTTNSDWTEATVSAVADTSGGMTVGFYVWGATTSDYSVAIKDAKLVKDTGSTEPEEPVTSDGELGNGGFETALTPWVASDETLATAAWRKDARTGNYALQIGSSDEAVKATVTQKITGLTPGDYTFTVYSQAGDTADSFYVNAGGRTQTLRTGWDSWMKNTLTGITVGDSGTLTVTIRADAPAGFWALLDDAALTKVEEGETTPPAGSAENPEQTPADNKMPNLSFVEVSTDDLEPKGWVTDKAGSGATVEVSAREKNHSGGTGGVLTVSGSDSVDINRTFKGLSSGVYTFSIYSKAVTAGRARTVMAARSATAAALAAAGLESTVLADAKLEPKVSIYVVGKDDQRTQAASVETNWEENKVSIVKSYSGDLTVGIHVENAAGHTVMLDSPTLTREPSSASGGDVENVSFESGLLTPWKTTDKTVAIVQNRTAAEKYDAYDGDHVLVIGSDEKDIDMDVTQTITGLSPGSYFFSIYSQASDTAEEFYIYGMNSERTWGTPEWKTDVKTGWKWAENRLYGIEVGDDGKAVIGIHVEAPAGFWAIFDEASLEWRPSSEIKNPSFERHVGGAPLVDWTATENISNVSVRTPYGGRAMKASGKGAYTADVHQEVTGLLNGWYYLTAYAKSTGGQPLSVVYGYGTDQSRSMTSIPATEGDGALLPIKEQWVKVVVRGIHVTDGKATVGFETNAEAGQYVLLDNFVLAWEENQEVPYELMKGGDTSCVSYVEDCGGVYYDADGKTAGDLYQLLADNGWNIARLRLYNNPGKGRGNGTYYCLDGYEDLSDILLAAKRAKEKGMQVQLSFHYSDFWSNGSEQYIPAEWMEKIDGKSSEEAVRILERCVYDYTRDVMLQMRAQGTTPEYVSLGNEMQAGLLYPLGKASTETWPNLARFLNAGYKAVKSVSPDTRVILHLDDAGNEYKYTNFFDNCRKYKVNYDIIGCSYYPFWTKMSVQTIVDFCDMLIERYHKDIIVMETGFGFDDHLPAPNRHQTGQLSHNIPYSDPNHSAYQDSTVKSLNPNISTAYKGNLPSATPEMQREFMIELFNGLKSIGLGTENRCVGDLYWDPILVEQDGVGWAMWESTDLPDRNAVSNTTLFGFDHQLLPVMDAYRNNAEGGAAGAVSGKLKTEKGTGIANASLTLRLDKDYTVTTDAYGGFRVAGVPAGTYSASIAAPGLSAGGGAVTVTVTAGETVRQDFTAGAASLSGTVTDQNGPAAGVKVIATSGNTVHQMVTGSDGRYSFPAIAAASYTVTAQKMGYTVAQEKTVSLAQQQAGTADLLMDLTSGTASGKVTAQDGSPMQGVNINAGSGITGTTGADGTYFLSGLMNAQQYTLAFSKSGYASERKVCTGATGVNAEVNVTLLEDKGAVTGLLRNNAGEPVAGATVQCVQNWVPTYAVTDENGRFVLNDLMSGEALVEISAVDMVSQDVTCNLTPGGTVDVGFITMPEKITLQNPSFDPNVSGWKSGSDRFSDDSKKTVRYQYRNPGSQYDGEYALSFWNSSAFTEDVTQTVELTAPGVYVFRVHSYAGLTYSQFGSSEFYMYVKDGNGETVARGDIPNSGVFIPNEVVFKVSEAGSYTLGFHASAKGEDWALLDMAELGRLCHPKFTDIDTGAWYHEAADYVLNNGLMSGYGNGLFGTSHPLSRAQLAQILYNLEGRPELSGGGQFQDVPENAWYYNAVTWAESCGIATGYGNGLFGAEDAVTREQFAVILWNYAKFKGIDVAAIGSAASGFSDFSDTGEYAVPAMEWAVSSEIIKGKDGRLDPKGCATRAEAAQMLKNFLVKTLHK